MKTQRVNLYRTVGIDGQNVYYIQEYSPVIHEWVTVGQTYDVLEHAQTLVDNHNLKQLLFKLKEYGEVR